MKTKEEYIKEYLESNEIDEATTLSYAGVVDLLNDFWEDYAEEYHENEMKKLPKSEEELREYAISFAQYVKPIKMMLSNENDTDHEEFLFYRSEYKIWRDLLLNKKD